jgi:YebC/PmpR family DNA-binding regulatory protein
MPAEGVERAIKRALGQSDGFNLTEATFEGYGPGGAAILVQVLTDNRNRALAQVRHTFSHGGGSMGESGCVSWLFEQKGVIVMEADEMDAEDMALAAIDAGAEDVKIEGNTVEVYTNPEDLEAVRKALEQSFAISSAELSLVSKTAVKLEDRAALQALKLLERLEELDEVQHVFTNADFPNDVVQSYRG